MISALQKGIDKIKESVLARQRNKTRTDPTKTLEYKIEHTTTQLTEAEVSEKELFEPTRHSKFVTVMFSAIYTEKLNMLPNKYQTIKYLKRACYTSNVNNKTYNGFAVMAQHGTIKNLKPEVLQYLLANYDIDLHAASKHGNLDKIPLTISQLEKTDSFKRTVLHCAVASNHLDQCLHFLSPELCKKQDKYNNTIWHVAAMIGNIKELPLEWITEDIIIQPNKWGSTVIEILNNSRQLNYLAGIDWSDTIKPYFPESWWNMNKTIISGKNKLCGNTVENNIEMF